MGAAIGLRGAEGSRVTVRCGLLSGSQLAARSYECVCGASVATTGSGMRMGDAKVQSLGNYVSLSALASSGV